MADRAAIPLFPAALARAARRVPLPVIRLPLERLSRTVAARHPGIFQRLGRHAAMSFLLDPIDLPFVFRLSPSAPEATIPGTMIDVLRRPVAAPWDARIAGPLAALLGMVHGRLDGDALFFSRDLVVEGDTEAVLALRNAIDDAEIDLVAEAFAALGPLGRMLDGPARAVLPVAERLTGVALSRAAERPA